MIGVLVLLQLASCAARSDRTATPRSLPAVKQDCGSCHSLHGGSVAGLRRASITALCLSCHPERSQGREHVVDVVPTMEVTHLPLYEGRITCATCHDPHADPYGALLRLPGTELCRACHRK